MDAQPTDADWRCWLDKHGSALWLFARQKTRSEMDAEDLVQEAVLEAAQKTAAGLPDRELVFATIHRRAIDRARREDRRKAREVASAEDQPTVWFDVTAEERERASLIQDALAKLSDDHREVITLKIWGELSFAEIAEALEIPANTAASRYRYALEELRKLSREVFS